MPLRKGEKAKKAIPELMAGPTHKRTAAKFGKKRADKQSVAIALANERKGRGRKKKAKK